METRRDWHEDTPAPDGGKPTDPVLDRTYKPALTTPVVDAIVGMQEYLGYLMRELATGHLDSALTEADQVMSQGVYVYQQVKIAVNHCEERNNDIFRGETVSVEDVQ